MKFLSALLAIACIVMSGCNAPKQTYYWGNYEPSTYALYSKPGKLDLQTQAQLLEQDLQKGEARHLLPAPGLHAQLGYVYFQMGRLDEARRQFSTEKELFPESAVLMDRMLSRLNPEGTKS